MDAEILQPNSILGSIALGIMGGLVTTAKLTF